MYVGTAKITMHIPASASLKDKRQVVRSVLQRLRNEFGVAAAEVANQDLRQLAVLGLASVSGEAGHAQDVLDNAVRAIEQWRPDVEISDVYVDVISVDE